MIRKFALLATAAALMVACGGATEEEMKAKAQASADSAAAATAKIEADLKRVADSTEAAAKAAMDTIAVKVEGAVDAATGH